MARLASSAGSADKAAMKVLSSLLDSKIPIWLFAVLGKYGETKFRKSDVDGLVYGQCMVVVAPVDSSRRITTVFRLVG
jgi:predicted nucleotidyltransferase